MNKFTRWEQLNSSYQVPVLFAFFLLPLRTTLSFANVFID